MTHKSTLSSNYYTSTHYKMLQVKVQLVFLILQYTGKVKVNNMFTAMFAMWLWLFIFLLYLLYLSVIQNSSNNSCSTTTVPELSGSSTHDTDEETEEFGWETEEFGCKTSTAAGDQITLQGEKYTMA